MQEIKKFSTIQLLNFCLGFFGLQFAWQMRIILSGPVTESLGASPFLFGLIWLAGPVTGIVVQPVIGALSDHTQTRFGRRVPYLFFGALFAAIGLFILPNSGDIAGLFTNAPSWLGLLIAAVMIWIIDACVNAAQGPYRAIIPDNMPKEQHSVANSFLSFAIGLGSVIAAGTAPFLNFAFHYQMSTRAQFYMAGLAFLLAMIWTCITIKERKIQNIEKEENKDAVKSPSFFDSLKEFFKISPEVSKICLMQFFAWIGLMSMMIFFTQYSVHTVFGVPDLASAGEEIKNLYLKANLEGQNFSSICFAVFNLICFIVALPIGKIAAKYGNKNIHIISLISMALAYLIMAFVTDKNLVIFAMGLAGIGWSSTLALPFAMLSKYIKEGTEGSVMGIFNIFIAAPQVLVCTILAKFIDSAKITLEGGMFNNHWEYAFLIGAIMLLLAALTTFFVKENK